MQATLDMMNKNLVRKIVEIHEVFRKFQFAPASLKAFAHLKQQSTKYNKLHQHVLTDIKEELATL